MGAVQKPPPIALVRISNRVVGPLLNSPLHGLLSRALMLLSYTGIRSGRTITIPIGYVPWDEGSVLAASTRTVWVSNLRAGQPVRLRIRGRWHHAEPTVIEDQDTKIKLIVEFVRRKGPKAAAALRIGLPAEQEPSHEEIAAAATRGRFVRFELTT